MVKHIRMLVVPIVLTLSACVQQPQIETFASADPQPKDVKEVQPFLAQVRSLAFLTENSPLVFLGSLREQEVFRDKRNLIVTRNQFEIEEIILGDFAEKTIVLNLLGGTLEAQTLRVSHLPDLHRGLSYVIFTDPARTTYNPITANENGVFLVSPDRQGVFTVAGYDVIGIEDGVIVTSPNRGAAEFLPRTAGEFTEGQKPVTTEPTTGGNVLGTKRRQPLADKAISYKTFADFVRRFAAK